MLSEKSEGVVLGLIVANLRCEEIITAAPSGIGETTAPKRHINSLFDYLLAKWDTAFY